MNSTWPDGPTDDLLKEVNRERWRQEELRRAGKFPWTCAAPEPSAEAKFAVLGEEVGEVARHVTESLIDPARLDVAKLRKELIEVAAVAKVKYEGGGMRRMVERKLGRLPRVAPKP